MYSYDSRAFTVMSQTEHYDKGFQMDTSFYNRTGFTSNWTFAQINRYPKDSNFWVKRYTAFYWNKALKDRIEHGTETFHLFGFRMNFTRQGNFRIDQGYGYEPFASQRFKSDRLRVMGGVQITRWLNINGNFNTGWATFYDPVAPFQGKSKSGNISVTWQPNSNFNQNVSANHVVFDRASTGERVFAVRIVNTRSTYQFNKHFFLRGIAQYDSSKRRRVDGLPGLVRAGPGIGDARRLWIVDRKARSGFGLSNREPRAVFQGVISSSILMGPLLASVRLIISAPRPISNRRRFDEDREGKVCNAVQSTTRVVSSLLHSDCAVRLADRLSG